MKKKDCSKPQMDIVMLQQMQALLTGSYDGPANAPEVNFLDDSDIVGNGGEFTFGDDTMEF